MTAPDVRYKSVVLHLSPLADFTRQFGDAVRAAGGKYSDVRGNATHRFVTLPAGCDDLLDRIVAAFPHGAKTTLVVEDLWTEEHGFRVKAVVGNRTWLKVFDYRPSKTPEMSPSEFLASEFSGAMEKVDWATWFARWDEEDAAEASRKRAYELRTLMDDLRHRIAEESIRILHGANDLDPLKELAAEYEALCEEAGVELDLTSGWSDDERVAAP
ncbi:hypothetical protein [Rhizobium leguminosarum]|uniref:hypothetical protein n=1 Tax=Rhizobium leguminosarum TaxID=384 RepID=UPI002E11A6A7|nr:hypothetical protein U8Q02_42500 [Rhizobium leguminosarum]